MSGVSSEADPFDLGRFLSAQETTQARALAELRRGRKESHWMWFVFPQLAGLGRSETARHYAIRSLAEARAYLAHPVLGPDCARPWRPPWRRASPHPAPCSARPTT